jgi:hypothetical protein
MPVGLLLKALATQVQLRAGQGDDVELVHHRSRLGQLLSGRGLVAAEPVHGHHLDLITEDRCLGSQPGCQGRGRTPGHQVEQPGASGSVQSRGQVDDDGDEPLAMAGV